MSKYTIPLYAISYNDTALAALKTVVIDAGGGYESTNRHRYITVYPSAQADWREKAYFIECLDVWYAKYRNLVAPALRHYAVDSVTITSKQLEKLIHEGALSFTENGYTIGDYVNQFTKEAIDKWYLLLNPDDKVMLATHFQTAVTANKELCSYTSSLIDKINVDALIGPSNGGS